MIRDNFELHNKTFFDKTINIMTLVVLQQLITIGINFLDNIMVGSFGETQISAASFGNQFYSFFQFICMGLGSGAIVMSAQFWGRKELHPMRTVAAIAMRVSLVLCTAFTLISVIEPQWVLRLFTNDMNIIGVGTSYVRLIGFTFLPSGMASTATYLMRSIGKTRVPLIGSIIAFVLNLFFNWVFIFGKLGAPRLELTGAAVGTVIARLFEFAFVFGYFIFKEKDYGFRLKHFALSGASLHRQYVRFSIPVLVSDTLLGLSLMLTSVVLGHIGEEISAATAIVNSAAQLLTVLSVGMAGAASVVVGNTIGAGDIPRAKRESNTYILLGLLVGLIAVPIMLLLEKPYIGLYNINATTLSITHGMVICLCFMIPLQTIAYVLSKGILRGGGDTRFLLVADSSMVWFVSLPLGALSGFVWKLAPVWTFLFLKIEFPLKGMICFVRYCTGKWINEISGKE